jgi:hypothetical protein
MPKRLTCGFAFAEMALFAACPPRGDAGIKACL